MVFQKYFIFSSYENRNIMAKIKIFFVEKWTMRNKKCWAITIQDIPIEFIDLDIWACLWVVNLCSRHFPYGHHLFTRTDDNVWCSIFYTNNWRLCNQKIIILLKAIHVQRHYSCTRFEIHSMYWRLKYLNSCEWMYFRVDMAL